MRENGHDHLAVRDVSDDRSPPTARAGQNVHQISAPQKLGPLDHVARQPFAALLAHGLFERLSPHARRRRHDGGGGVWTYFLVGVALLVVGFGLMSIVMYFR